MFWFKRKILNNAKSGEDCLMESPGGREEEEILLFAKNFVKRHFKQMSRRLGLRVRKKSFYVFQCGKFHFALFWLNFIAEHVCGEFLCSAISAKYVHICYRGFFMLMIVFILSLRFPIYFHCKKK